MGKPSARAKVLQDDTVLTKEAYDKRVIYGTKQHVLQEEDKL